MKKIQVIKFFVFIFIFNCTSKLLSQNEQENLIFINSDSISYEFSFNLEKFYPNLNLQIDENIRSIFQDKKGNYWFGTNSEGVFYFDGKVVYQFTELNGLPNNQILSIQEDEYGNIWFGTGVFGVSKFDGSKFTTYTNFDNTKPLIRTSYVKSKLEIWFNAGDGAFCHCVNKFVFLPFEHSKLPHFFPFDLSSFSVYSSIKDKNGNQWFGTQSQGVAFFDGKSIKWLFENGLSGSAVLGIFEDSHGNIWFGNNGAGLFKYDGKSLINFTEKYGLGNKAFKITGESDSNSLARVYSINEDSLGNIWVGTVDAGVWKFDGNKFTNYGINFGLNSLAINTIFKDKNGVLLFGSDENGIFLFNGKSFEKFVIK